MARPVNHASPEMLRKPNERNQAYVARLYGLLKILQVELEEAPLPYKRQILFKEISEFAIRVKNIYGVEFGTAAAMTDEELKEAQATQTAKKVQARYIRPDSKGRRPSGVGTPRLI